jgi:hypothetical protein
MNREQRRHPEKAPQQAQDESLHKNPEQEMREQGRTQDALDPRAKNTGHKKKTADKWNQ